MTLEFNPHDKSVNPGMHDAVERENVSRAMGGTPKDPYSGIPQNIKTNSRSGVGDGGAGLILLLFFFPAFIPFFAIGHLGYKYSTTALAAPTFFGWVIGVIGFCGSIVLAFQFARLFPRWSCTAALTIYFGLMHFLAARFFTINPWWLYGYAAIGAGAGYILASAYEPGYIGSPRLAIRLTQIALWVMVAGAGYWTFNHQPYQRLWRPWLNFVKLAHEPWNNYWATMPYMTSLQIPTIQKCARYAEAAHPPRDKVQWDIYDQCLEENRR